MEFFDTARIISIKSLGQHRRNKNCLMQLEEVQRLTVEGGAVGITLVRVSAKLFEKICLYRIIGVIIRMCLLEDISSRYA